MPTKKTTKKETAPKDVTVTVEENIQDAIEIDIESIDTIEEVNNASVAVDDLKKDVLEPDNINVENTEKIMESIESVDTEIKMEEQPSIEEELKKSIEPLEDIKNINEEILESQEALSKKIEAEPEKAEEIIKNEIKKVEEIKKNVEKIIKETKRPTNSSLTSWWNGIEYDY